MSGAYSVAYGNAYDSGGLRLSDTQAIQKPVDYVLAGQQPYRESGREWDIPPSRRTETVRVTRSGVRQLGGGKPSYTTRSGPLGGSHK